MIERMIPLFTSVAGLKIMVFGGGNVAHRKCAYFEGAEMTVMAETILPEIRQIAGTAIEEKIPENLEQTMDGYDLIVAATNDKELNDRICRIAASLDIPVNSAHGGGSILIPSVLRRDKYVVAVSSEGRVPAFPPFLIAELDKLLDDRYDRLIDLLIELRAISKEKIRSQPERRRFLELVLSDAEVMDAVNEGRMSDAKTVALEIGGLS